MATETGKLEILHNAIRSGIGKRFRETPEGVMAAKFNRDCYVIDSHVITEGLVPQCVDVKEGVMCTVEAYTGDAMSLVRFPSGDEALAFTGELDLVD